MARILIKRTPLLIAAITAIMLTNIIPAQAQGYRGYEHWYIGLNLGTSKFYGDISGKTSGFSNASPFSGDFYNDRGFMYGLMLTKRFNGIFWTRLNLLTTTLGSENENLDFYFKSDLVEFSLSGIVSLSEMIGGNDPDRLLNVYAFAGAGMVSYRAWKRQLDTDSLIETEGTGSRKAANMVFPFGLGVDFRVTPEFTISGEFSLRHLQTDRVDAHGGDRGMNEGYGYINLGLHYQFDMPEGVFRRNTRYNGKSTDPAIRAYNKDKATVMKTKAYKQANRDKRKLEREKKEWLILKLFKKTRLDMATE
ncbi:MAG: outer membrane beta-barrel protein [Bacteroidales bacterium]